LLFLPIVPAVLLTVTAVARYLHGWASIDLAIFDQGLWAASRGHGPWSSIVGESLLGDHFAPGWLAFVPLYRIVASPVWLLLAQGAAAGAAAILVACRLRASIGDRTAGLAGAALLVSPPVAYALLSDVHSVVLGVPFALACGFALQDGQPRRALVLGLLAASFRVELAAAVVACFMVLPGDRRDRLRPTLVLGAYLALAVFLEGQLGHGDSHSVHFAGVGGSPIAALLHPWRLVDIAPTALAKALPWLACGAFLALLRPRLAVPALVAALPSLISAWPGTSKLWFQYGLAPTFLLALAWIPVVARRPQLAKGAIVAPIAFALMVGPLPSLVAVSPGRHQLARYWTHNPRTACVTSGIPEAAGVSTDATTLTAVAERRHAYLWPYPFAAAPAESLPSPHLQRPRPELAKRVDYVIAPRDEAWLAGPGFVEDGGDATSVRLRRAATTVARPAVCP
jgi:uncharacterized membrane protein